MSERIRPMAVIVVLALIYFGSYPEDAQAILTPLTTLLNLTNSVSPWFYGMVAVGMISTAIVKIWGGQRQA